MNNLETLKQWIEESKHIVFFGGAGVSTDSGIPDFRYSGFPECGRTLQSKI